MIALCESDGAHPTTAGKEEARYGLVGTRSRFVGKELATPLQPLLKPDGYQRVHSPLGAVRIERLRPSFIQAESVPPVDNARACSGRTHKGKPIAVG